MAYIGNAPSAVTQNVTSDGITDGTIQNVDIAADAAIAATKIAGLSTVATTGAYSDVSGTPTLATVATTGAYSDITGTPTLPTDFVSAASGGTFGGNVNFGTNKITYSNVYSTVNDLPTASNFHGMFAHAHDTGKGYYAHGGNWIELVNVDANGDLDLSGELKADSYNETYVSLSGATPAVDCEAGNAFSIVLSAATTFTFTNPPASGTSFTFSVEVIQDASASGYAVTWPTVTWPAGTAPTLTATANAVDYFVFTTRDGGTTWRGFTAGQALA